MGRKRRKVVKVLKKRIPKVFLCPKCNQQSIRIEITEEDNERKATVRCGNLNCGYVKEMVVKPYFKEVDVYCQLIDEFYGT
ncbi:MAG: hypothetical protein QXT26_05030 [Thermoproteota archaeon]